MRKYPRSKLEEAFFLKKDIDILKKLKEMQRLKETKEALAEASGIHDDMVLQKLVDLDIRPESVASVSVVPLVIVAWADGEMEAKEKKAVLSAVEKLGWTKDGWDYSLLNRWLEHKPAVSLLDAWMHYVGALCKRMSDEEVERFKEEIMSHAKTVALACGGVLGIGKISGEESKLLKKLSSAFAGC